MTSQGKRILARALELPPTERATLVEELLSSFDFPSRQEVDRLRAEEAEKRIGAYERGEMRSALARKVFGRLDLRKRT